MKLSHLISCRLSVVFALFVFIAMKFTVALWAEDFFVSPQGNDAWSGRLAAPNGEQTDGPFASLQRAQQAVRELRQKEPSREQPVVVAIRGGRYFLEEPLRFEPADSGSEKSPTIYQAYQSESPVISGGVSLNRWTVDDQGRWHLVLEEVKTGRWNFAQLFVNGQRRYRPRLPKKGYYTIAERVPPPPEKQKLGDDRLQYADTEFDSRWQNLGDVEVNILHYWSMSRMKLATIDVDKKLVTFKRGTGSNSWWAQFLTGHRYYIENVKESLSEPGEFYLDSTTGELIYIPQPGEDPKTADVIAPRLENLLIFACDGLGKRWVEHIQFRGLIFAHSNWVCPADGQFFPQAEVGLDGAISAIGARHVVFDTCAVIHTGTYAMAFGAGCQNCRVENCELVDLGAGGVKIGHAGSANWQGASQRPEGEDALVSHITVKNCTIAHGGRLHPAAVGVWIGHSPYNTIEHNDIFDFYYTGVSVGWTWGYADSPAHHNAINYNHIYNIGQYVLSDMGGVYTLGVSPGTTVNHNKIHDVYSFSYGGWGLYTDEGSSHIEMAYNLVYRTKTGSFHQHYGKENRIHNNILVNSVEHQIQRTRTEEHISFFFERNIVAWDNDSPLLGSNWKDNNFRMDHNLYWHAGKPIVFPGNLTLEQWQKDRNQDLHSIIADPKFVDPANDDYRLQADSPAFKLGFEAFDPNQAGRQGKPALTANMPDVPPGLPKRE
ncbi:MAG: right-handed parallel beta-helix repeat-containing protein [Thermogutta sp.]